jgi:hypothetical protein
MPTRGAGRDEREHQQHAPKASAPATTTPATADPFQLPKERLADKIGGLASAVLQVPAAVHARTATGAASAASRDAALHRERALARLGSAVHQSLPSALQDFDRELDVALEQAEAVQRCLSVLEGAEARRRQQQERAPSPPAVVRR